MFLVFCFFFLPSPGQQQVSGLEEQLEVYRQTALQFDQLLEHTREANDRAMQVTKNLPSFFKVSHNFCFLFPFFFWMCAKPPQLQKSENAMLQKQLALLQSLTLYS
jgi:hypothetical protein